MIVVISWTEWLQDMRLEKMVETTNATAYTDSLPNDRTAYVFDTATNDWLDAQWRSYSNTQLAHIFNALAPTMPVKKFENRDVALRRVGLKIIDLVRDLEFTTFNPPPTLSDRNEHQAQMLEGADAFYACAFRGQPKGFDKVETKTLEEACEAARTLYLDRAVAIYAVRAGRQTHIENYDPTQEKVEMAREAKIGEFKSVGRTTHLGKIIAAHQDGVTHIDELATTVGLTVDQVVAHLRTARGNNGINHAVDKESRQVTLTIPDDVEVFKADKEPTVKEPKAPRELKYGEFKQVRADSNLGKIIAAAPGTAQEIGTLTDLTAEQVIENLKRARVSHGITYEVAEGAEITVSAHNMPEDTVLIKPAAEPRAQRDPDAPRAPRTNAAMEAAKQGVMPSPPDFSAATHKPWRKKLEAVQAMVDNRDVDGLRAFEIKTISTSPRALDRYRNAAITAIEAGEPQAQAAE